MSFLNNTSVQEMCIKLALPDYIQGVGLYMLLDELEKCGKLDAVPDVIFFHELGYLSQQMSRKLSQFGRDKIRDIYRDTKRDIVRDNERDRKRGYRERKRNGPSSPFPPTPPIPPISPKEKESEVTSPLSLRDNAPKGAGEGKASEIPEGFERFWTAYPRRVAKQTAIRAWRALKPNSQVVDSIIADVEKRVRSEWRGRETQYIPHPATYLNGRRWEDETEVSGVVHGAGPVESDQDIWAGLTPEQIAEYDRIASDPNRPR